MGVVYQATQEALKRPVALKMIRADRHVDPSQLGRFRVEAEAVARLRHPNVVQIYEVGEVGGVPYFSLELLEGGTLAERLAGAPMSPRPAAELAVTLARALAAVHRVGIVHRDLKPSNVLFDAAGTPKVTDFGLAKRLEVEEGQTLSGQVMGTPSYMAREQALGQTSQIGPPADIYALGAILYETLTGRPPFRGPSPMETLGQVIFDEPVPPSRLQPRVPRDLETIALKCLAKSPARRYATADDLADDLERFLKGKPIRARRTPAWERTVKWARRHPTTAALTVIGLAAAIGLAVASERYAVWKRDQARRRDERVAELRLKAVDALDQGLRLRTSRKLEDARLTLATLVEKIHDEPGLGDLHHRADGELSDVKRQLAADASAAADRERLAGFRRLRDRALLLDGNAAFFPRTLVQADEPAAAAPDTDTDVEADDDAEAIRATARAALDVFPLGETPGPLPEALSAEERAEVEADRYLLLMVLSEAVARALPGEDPRQQAHTALELLDRSAALHAPTPAWHLRRADCYDRLGDAAAVRSEHERSARIAPADAFDHLLLGREAYRRNALDEARTHLKAALRLRPDSFWARSLLSVAALKRVPPRAAEAETELTACLLQQPSYAWLYLLRGSASGEIAVALAATARSPAVPGTNANANANAEAEAQARFADAEADFRKAQELGLENGLDYMLLMNRGVMRFQRGQFDAAAADFEAAIALKPRRYHAYASLAQVHHKLGRQGEAVARLDEAIAREPGLAALYRARAWVRLDRDRDPDQRRDNLSPGAAEPVLHDLETSARLDGSGSPAAADDHARRGRLLLELGRPDDALNAADAALADAPDAAAAQAVRVAALLALGRFGDAIDVCDAALAAGPASAALQRLRGLARAGRDDFAGAVEDYTLALALHPDNPAEIYGDRGWAHLLAGAPAMAHQDFDSVLRLDPADPAGYAGRASARVRLGRVREGLADAEESLRLTRPTPRLLYIAAQTYTLASVHAVASVARTGRAATRDSLAYEARAADLLAEALERTPADHRTPFWRDVVARDVLLRPLWRNPRIVRRLQPEDVGGVLSQREPARPR
jgi:tetratricopeptide (TPR) repeat protein